MMELYACFIAGLVAGFMAGFWVNSALTERNIRMRGWELLFGDKRVVGHIEVRKDSWVKEE